MLLARDPRKKPTSPEVAAAIEEPMRQIHRITARSFALRMGFSALALAAGFMAGEATEEASANLAPLFAFGFVVGSAAAVSDVSSRRMASGAAGVVDDFATRIDSVDGRRRRYIISEGALLPDTVTREGSVIPPQEDLIAALATVRSGRFLPTRVAQHMTGAAALLATADSSLLPGTAIAGVAVSAVALHAWDYLSDIRNREAGYCAQLENLAWGSQAPSE